MLRGVSPPKDRGQDRLLARTLGMAQAAYDYDPDIERMNVLEVLEMLKKLDKTRLVAASDGGARHGVATWAVTTEGNEVVAGDVMSQETSAFRAELEGATVATEATTQLFEQGGYEKCTALLILDCRNVMDVMEGGGRPWERFGLVDNLRRARRRITRAGGALAIAWVQSHGKKHNSNLSYPLGVDEKTARRHNDYADKGATGLLDSRCATSTRAAYYREVEDAKSWSTAALNAANKIRARYMAFLEKAGTSN